MWGQTWLSCPYTRICTVHKHIPNGRRFPVSRDVLGGRPSAGQWMALVRQSLLQYFRWDGTTSYHYLIKYILFIVDCINQIYNIIIIQSLVTELFLFVSLFFSGWITNKRVDSIQRLLSFLSHKGGISSREGQRKKLL